MVREYEYTFDDLVRNLVEYTQSNPDCNAKAISQNVLAFLNEVAEANNGIGESERDALLEAEESLHSGYGRVRYRCGAGDETVWPSGIDKRVTGVAPPCPAAPPDPVQRTRGPHGHALPSPRR